MKLRPGQVWEPKEGTTASGGLSAQIVSVDRMVYFLLLDPELEFLDPVKDGDA